MKTLAILAAASSLCSVGLAQPGEEAGGPGAPHTKNALDFEVGLNADYAFRSDLDNSVGGDVAVTRSMASFWMGHDCTESFRATLKLTSEFSWYDFGGSPSTTLIPGTNDPFGQLLESDITLGGQYKVNGEWTAVGGVFFRWAGESGADLSDAFTWGGYAGARYQASKDFSIMLGVRANTRLEDSTAVLPLFAFDWAVSEKVKLQIIPAVGGAGLRVTSQINDAWAFLIDGEYQTRAYRLEDIAPLPEGVVRDSRVQIGLGAVWTPTPKISVTARAGVVAWQEFEIDSDGGAQLSEAESDPTPYIFVGGTISF